MTDKHKKYKKKYMKLKEKFYYHGSPNLIKDYIDARPSHVIDGESAVFATKREDISLMFSAKWYDKDISFGSTNGKWFAIEQYKNAFDLLKVPGYLYTIVGNFVSDKRLGLKNIEFISKEPAKIVSCEKINNIYEKLIEMKTIHFIHYSQRHNLTLSNIDDYPVMKYIINGRKTVEIRNNSEPNKKIKLGDLMIFDDGKVKAVCLVKNIIKYDTVKDIIKNELKNAFPDIKQLKSDKEIYEIINELGEEDGLLSFHIQFLYPE
jgi:ASC-1-like (ASCH) protein